jgi:hypothetical protein
MAVFFPVISLALALIATGRGAASGQFHEVERRRDRYARYVCLALGLSLLVAYVGWLIL